MIVGAGGRGAGWSVQAWIAVGMTIVPLPILALGASAIVPHGNTGSFAGTIDTFNALGAAALAGGHVAGTSGLAAVAAQASLPHAASWQSAG